MVDGLLSLLFILTQAFAFAGESFGELKSADQIIEKMTVEQKAGQLFILGFTGSDYHPALKKQIDHIHPGAIIVFGRNIKSLNQVKAMNEKAQTESRRKSGVPLLIAVDQEGGNVIRIKTSPSLPSARTLALTNNEALVQDAGYVTGQLMSALGFNMNLAPVVDISSPEVADFLGSRTFSHEKDVVNQMSTAFSKGLIDAGVLPTAKHFPGHGGVAIDSHLATPYKQVTLTELLFNDLAPYKEMQKQRIPFAIMSSHISYPLIDASKRPASFSPLLLDKVLRQGLGFNGILMTDDIQMEGARDESASIEKRTVDAILAGNDLVMVGWNFQIQRRAHAAVVKAIKSGVISEERLNASLRRLLNHKMQFFRAKPPADLKLALSRVPLKQTFDRIFNAVIKNQAADIDLSQKQVEVMSFSWQFLTACKEGSPSRLHHLQQFRGWDKLAKADRILFHLTGPSSQKILATCPPSLHSKLIVINASSETRVPRADAFAGIVQVHSHHPRLGAMAALHLTSPKKTLRTPSSEENSATAPEAEDPS